MTGQPTTRAGRALLESIQSLNARSTAADILAIEAEAREECEERNRNLQATLDLLTRDDTIVCDPEHHAQELAEARAAALAEPRRLVDEQAEDEGLWFVAETAAEAYLQQELRRLHAAVEGDALAETPEETR